MRPISHVSIADTQPTFAPSDLCRKRESSEPSGSDFSSEDDKPVKAKAKKLPKKKAKDEDESDSKAGPSKSKADKKPAVKKEKEKAVKKEKEKEKKEDDEPEEEVYKWWEQEKQDNSIKWNSLVHAGVLFPPPYEPLPKNIKMKYDGQHSIVTSFVRPTIVLTMCVSPVLISAGKPLTLPPRSEEVAGFFAAMIETDHAKDATFQANFFRDFKQHLELFPPVRPRRFSFSILYPSSDSRLLL